MKQLIVTVALIILGVFIANTLVLGEGDSLKSGTETLATTMIGEIKDVKGAPITP